MVRPREEWPPQPRPSLIVQGYEEWAAVVRRLSAAGMIVFLDRVERINGAFAVPKPDGGLRFIFNGTAANEVFFEPPRVDLPTPSHVAELEVPGGAAVFVAKTDLSDFFHSFRVEPWLLPFFAMPAVRAGDVGAMGCEVDSMVFPCLATVPMGWNWSVLCTQEAHRFVLYSRTSARKQDELGAPDKVINRPRHGLYVDDFMQLVTEPALRRARHLRGEYLDATRAVGWVAKPAKMIDFTARPTDLLGILFDGVRASYGLSPDKIAGLIARTLQLCEVGSVTMAHLRAILGSWCWALLVRRPAFSVLEHVFGQLDPLARPQQRVQLWRTSVRELLCLVDLAPLLRASLGAPWFDTVFAVDASEDGLGGVLDAGKKVDAQACAQLGRACFELASGRQGRRASWSQGSSRTLPRPAARAVTPPPRPVVDVVGEEDSAAGERRFAWDTALRGARWVVFHASPVQRQEHITSLEVLAVRTIPLRVASTPGGIGSRILFLSDSAVALGALRKGRSSSHAMNLRCRQVAAHVLAADLFLLGLWVSTQLNPADEPSRRFGLPQARGRPGPPSNEPGSADRR